MHPLSASVTNSSHVQVSQDSDAYDEDEEAQEDDVSIAGQDVPAQEGASHEGAGIPSPVLEETGERTIPSPRSPASVPALAVASQPAQTEIVKPAQQDECNMAQLKILKGSVPTKVLALGRCRVLMLFFGHALLRIPVTLRNRARRCSSTCLEGAGVCKETVGGVGGIALLVVYGCMVVQLIGINPFWTDVCLRLRIRLRKQQLLREALPCSPPPNSVEKTVEHPPRPTGPIDNVETQGFDLAAFMGASPAVNEPPLNPSPDLSASSRRAQYQNRPETSDELPPEAAPANLASPPAAAPPKTADVEGGEARKAFPC